MTTADSVNEKPLTDPMEAAGQARREMVMAQRLINKALNEPPIGVPIMFFCPFAKLVRHTTLTRVFGGSSPSRAIWNDKVQPLF